MERIVGIEQIGVYTPGYSLALAELATARDVPVEKIRFVGVRDDRRVYERAGAAS